MEREDNSLSPESSVGRKGDNQPRNWVNQEETSGSMQPQAMEVEPIKWTDAKHSLYLDSMEAMFVNQLHDSLDLLGCDSKKYVLSRPKPRTQKHNPSGQFKYFQDGCWRKIDLSSGEFKSNKADESALLSSNPWIQRYRSGCREHTSTSPSVQQKDIVANAEDGFPVPDMHLGRQDSECCNTGSSNLSLEGTDQNFIDVNPYEEKQRGTKSAKRMKTTAVAGLNHDQVVPFCKLSYTEDVADNISSRL